MIEHPRTRNSYQRRIQGPVFDAVLRLRNAGYRVYREKDLHCVYFPKASRKILLTDLELSALAGLAA